MKEIVGLKVLVTQKKGEIEKLRFQLLRKIAEQWDMGKKFSLNKI